MELEQSVSVSQENKGSCLKSSGFRTFWHLFLIVYSLPWVFIKMYFSVNDGGVGDRRICFFMFYADLGYIVYAISFISARVVLIFMKCCSFNKGLNAEKVNKAWFVVDISMLVLNVIVTALVTIGYGLHFNDTCPEYVSANLLFIISDWTLCLARITILVLSDRAK